jgi:predicted ATPase/DNA-binding CsgD family transcriptional regulator
MTSALDGRRPLQVPAPVPAGRHQRPAHRTRRRVSTYPLQMHCDVSPLIGRDEALGDLERLVTRAPLVTLTGAPGVGKSRLAIELGRHMGGRLRDGASVAELASVTEPDMVPAAVARALGVGARPDAGALLDSLVDQLAGRQLLLILDDCEHVVDTVAQLSRNLLDAAGPSLRVVATSRRPLRAAGEHVWNVAPLGSHAAVELFALLARQVGGHVPDDPDSAADVGLLCHRLFGLPLAIELAAGRTRVLSPGQIAERLDAPAILSRATDTRAPRHSSMQATVDLSARLLDPSERQLFERLALFAGGCDLAAVEAVADRRDDALATVSALVDHSLVTTECRDDEPVRYVLPEPIARCAAADLVRRGELDQLRRHHAEHYVMIAERCEADLRGAHAPRALDTLRREEGNLRSALEWARTSSSQIALPLCGALVRFSEMQGQVDDCRAMLERLLDTGAGEPRLRATLLARAARLAWQRQDTARARALLEESLGVVDHASDELAVARRLRLLALVAMSDGDHARALVHGEHAAGVFRRRGDERGLASALIHLGWARVISGDAARAEDEINEALSIASSLGATSLTAASLHGLAFAARQQGDGTAARELLIGCLRARPEAGLAEGGHGWMWTAAAVAADDDRFAAAFQLLGGADAARRRTGIEVDEQFVARLQPSLERARRSLGVAHVHHLMEKGRQMSTEELITEAIASPGGVSDSPLTDREREVVELVADGLANGEIAERLFISKRTVEAHLNHIRQKVPFESRQHLMLWVLRERGADGTSGRSSFAA